MKVQQFRRYLLDGGQVPAEARVLLKSTLTLLLADLDVCLREGKRRPH